VAIRKWHYGKIMILWSWGGLIAALLLTQFMARRVEDSPLAHLLEFCGGLVILLVLSGVTWHWLGGKETG
jgi:hypothetical protein